MPDALKMRGARKRSSIKFQRPPEGEFTDFLKKLGAQAPPKQ